MDFGYAAMAGLGWQLHDRLEWGSLQSTGNPTRTELERNPSVPQWQQFCYLFLATVDGFRLNILLAFFGSACAISQR